MIWLVTNQRELFEFDDIKIVTVETCKKELKTWQQAQADSETTGTNCHLSKLLCFQLGNKKRNLQIVIDCTTVDIRLFKEDLERLFLIFHNGSFDLKFLYNYEIIPRKIYDTMIVEQFLHMGFPAGFIRYSLLEVAKRRLGISLDKSIRSEIANRGLDYDVIKYAASDVVPLEDIMESQLQECREKHCIEGAKVECSYIPSNAYMEWCGVKLDINRWMSKMQKDKKLLEESTKALNNFILKNSNLKDKFSYVDTQGDLFTGFSLDPTVTINWSSSKQVIEVAKILGFDTKVQDKKSGEDKDSVLEKHLKAQKGINDEFLKLYFDYQGYRKVVSSFGQGHLDAINPITGRIHTKFNTLGASSGRLSCGGGSDDELALYKGLPKGSCKLLNLQQLPHDAETRACFIPERGNRWVSCDFSSEEARLTADVSGDEEYYKEFTERTKDTHAMFAWACYEEECRALGCKDATEVKKKAKIWRDTVKSAEFAYTFSASAETIAKTANIPVEKAQAMVDRLDRFFCGLTAFKKKAAADVKRDGYILICPETGHKLYWWDHDKWLDMQKSFTQEFWEDYRNNHKGTGDEVAMAVRQHFQAADKYSKLGLNSRTQGRGAIIFKVAGTRLFDWVVEHGAFNKIKFCVGVHDEFNHEFNPNEYPEYPQVMQDIMESTAAIYCKSLPIPAEPSVDSHWVH